MANTDKDIVITPNTGQAADPTISFVGFDNVVCTLTVNPNGTLTVNRQFVSSVATGTAPFAVSSTTRVANLNVATAGTADIWTTARTVTIGSTGKSVNGSANVAWTLAELGAAAVNQTMHIGTTAVTINRASGALALTGVSIDGNAGTATTLQTARTIGGVSFNGSANINLPGVNAVGNQNTTGNAATATILQTTRSIALSGAATGTATNFNGSANISIPVTGLNATNLNAGIVPDARLIGTYSGITLRTNGGNTHVTTPNPGSPSVNDRTVFGLAQFKSDASAAVGAIVFNAPNTNSAIMHRLRIEGMIYAGGPTVLTVIQGYRTTAAWSNTSKINLGITNLQVRFGVTPGGNNCIILGDVGTTWSYPMLAITHAMFSHSGVTDAYCKDWTVGLITNLTGYTNVTTNLTTTAVNSSISGSAATLTTARLIGGVSFNGSANINLPGVNIAGNQNTTGSAATLTTTRAINGTNFNGSAAITTANWGTARNINGSSVNGSANVTTANWGTARTVTIGSTGKSVNGSANVAWSLAEIGAVPSSKFFTQVSGYNYVASNPTSSGSRVQVVSDGLGIVSGYSTGTNRPFTYDIAASFNLAGRAFEISADWVNAGQTPLAVRSLRDCCQGFSPWRRIATQDYASFSVPITSTGDITAFFSDDRLKTRLGTITDAVSKVKSLTGFYYEPNETAQALGYEVKREIGISAQDVEKILPEIIAPAPIDHQYLTIKYEKLAPLFVQAFKEQQAQIDQQQLRIDLLEQLVTAQTKKD